MPTRGQEDGPPFGARIHRRLNVVAGGERAPEAPRARLGDSAGHAHRGPPALGSGGMKAAARERQAGSSDIPSNAQYYENRVS